MREMRMTNAVRDFADSAALLYGRRVEVLRGTACKGFVMVRALDKDILEHLSRCEREKLTLALQVEHVTPTSWLWPL